MTKTRAAPPGVRDTARDAGVLVALVASALFVAIAMLLPTAAVGWLRTAMWLVAGGVLIARAPQRTEPTGAFRVLGLGVLLVGVAWGLLAGGDVDGRPDPLELQLLVPGVISIGVATMVATPTWRHRASLLDGVVVAAAAGAVLLGLVGTQTADSATLVAAFALAFAACLGPAVLVAGLSPGRWQPAPGTTLAAVALLATAVAGAGTVAASLRGLPIGQVTRAAWAMAPVVAIVLAVRPAPTYATGDESEVTRPPPVRMLGLTALAFVPAAAASLFAPDRLVAGLLVTAFATVVVAARVAVSARFDVEEARAAADVRFDALVEHAAEVLALLDESGRIFYVSRAVLDTFHVPPTEVLGLDLVELVHPEDVQGVEDMLGRVRNKPGVPVHGRLRLMDGHGSARHVEGTIVDLRHVHGVGAISLTIRDITERVTLERELVRQARTDSLTGLVTREVLIDRIDHVLTARTPGAALLFIDLDDFKLVNDGFGHMAGDRVLIELAERLEETIRFHDTAGRVGGDEFAILLEELEGTDAAAAAVEIAERIAAVGRRPIDVGGEPVEIGLSVGVAIPDGDMTTTELFTAADAAMYEAKRDKRGVAVYEPGMRGSSRSRLILMRDVRTAIERGQLTVAYQPIVWAETRLLHGVEALLRWEHPVLGNITPDLILDHADAVGMTADLTDLIVDTISQDMQTWRAATGRPLPVAVNLSAQQLVHIDPERVMLQLLGGPTTDGQLTVEVTETSMLGDVAAAARVLDIFRDAGCSIAIDDFGTGYASIGYLRRLPLDTLKIDREFIDGLTPRTAPRSFAGVIQGLAAALDLTTIAEGVETEEQLDAVRDLGCELVQGYLVSPALPMDDLVLWAADRPALSDLA